MKLSSCVLWVLALSLAVAVKLPDVEQKDEEIYSKEKKIKKDCYTVYEIHKNAVPIKESGVLIFEENFNGYILDENKWTKEKRLPEFDGDYEFVRYEPERIELSEGILKIMPQWKQDILEINYGDECTGTYCKAGPVDEDNAMKLRQIQSGMIVTRDKFSFRYGKVEIRASMPTGDFIVPYLFLRGAKHEVNYEGHSAGTIRIALTTGTRKPGKQPQLLGGIALGEHCNSNYSIDLINPDDFHIFGVEWKCDGIHILHSGSTYRVFNDTNEIYSNCYGKHKDKPHYWNDETMSPFDDQFYIGIGVGIGGDIAFDNTGSYRWLGARPGEKLEQFNNEREKWLRTWTRPVLQVDYIKVYSLNPSHT